MTKITILTILLFSTFAFSKQSFQEAQNLLLAELSTTKEKLKKEALEWEKKFYQSLIEDEDPNIKLLGYSKRISGFSILNEKNSLIDIATEINAMIVSEALSNKSLATIAAICSYQQLKALCDQNAIFDKQHQSMSDNAYIYFNSFNSAYKNNNYDEIKTLINDMADSTYIDTFMYLHEGFRIKLDNYVKDNPFPKNKLAMEKLWISEFTHLNFDELQEISDNMQDIMISTMIIGSKLAESIPAFRNLVEACKNNLEHEKSCLKIAELLINKSRTIISTQIGYAIKIEILKQQERTKELKQAESSKIEYTKHYECLANIMNYGSTYISLKGAEFLKITEPVERQTGEVAYFEIFAKLNYDYYANLGDANITNPKSCNKKAIN